MTPPPSADAARERLVGWWHAFDHPVVPAAAAAVAALLLTGWVVIRALSASGRIDRATRDHLATRWRSWAWVAASMLLPILLGAAWVILGVTALSLLCYREYSRATGLFREKAVGAVGALGIGLVAFACLDHWDRLFFAAAPLTCGLMAVVTLPQDRPRGYVQRVALGVLGFVLLGYSFGYLGYMANDPRFREVLVLILLAVELNDVFASCIGKAFGGPRLLPNTTSGKTVAGATGAVVLTTALVVGVGRFVFAGEPMARPERLVALGLIISVLGHLGDLVLWSIKRDAEVEQTGTALPGHGGLLDRFDSLVLVPPAVFHFVSLNLHSPLCGQAQRLLTGSP